MPALLTLKRVFLADAAIEVYCSTVDACDHAEHPLPAMTTENGVCQDRDPKHRKRSQLRLHRITPTFPHSGAIDQSESESYNYLNK